MMNQFANGEFNLCNIRYSSHVFRTAVGLFQFLMAVFNGATPVSEAPLVERPMLDMVRRLRGKV